MLYQNGTSKGTQVTGGELVTFKVSATALAVTVSDLISFYRRNRTVNRSQLAQIQLKANETLRIARARAVGDLARVNVEEIARTQYLIDSLNLDGMALTHAMMTLDQLSVELMTNLKGLGSA
jgi:hypothetical protein